MQVLENISLKPYNTFGVEVFARYFVRIDSFETLREVFSDEHLKYLPRLVLGGGSNLLLTKDVEGLVLKIELKGIHVSEQGDEILITAGAGETWKDLVNHSVDKGFGGIENLSLIPGSAGAAPIQNIGAYGVELKDVFYSLEAFEISTCQKRTFNAEECSFSYRESVFKNEFKNKYIITAITLKLHKKPILHTHYGAIEEELQKRHITEPTIKDVSDVVSSIRVAKLPDPSTIGNSGSFFKNPLIEQEQFLELKKQFPDIVNYPAPHGKIKLAAGWLIEQCGFKGKQHGNTGTWKNQALVIVNHGNASGKEIFDFSALIIQSVKTKFGVDLEREVNII